MLARGQPANLEGMAFDVDESDFEERVIERSTRGAGGRRLLGRVVRAVPHARPGPGGGDRQARRRRRAREGRHGSPTRTWRWPFRSGASRRSRLSGTARWSRSSWARSGRPRSSNSWTGSCPPPPTSSPRPTTRNRFAKALELDPRNAAAGVKLGPDAPLARERRAEASELLDPFQRRLRGRGPRGASPPGRRDRRTEARRRRDALARASPPGTTASSRAPSRGSRRRSPTTEDPERRDLLRKVMVAIFTELGCGPPAGARAPPPARGGAHLTGSSGDA